MQSKEQLSKLIHMAQNVMQTQHVPQNNLYCKTLTDIKNSVITRHDKYGLQQY